MSKNSLQFPTLHRRSIAVIGLGYVGLPVMVAFAKAGQKVIGFDIDRERVRALREGYDATAEVDDVDLRGLSPHFSYDDEALCGADFFIVTVPTPIDTARRPDLRALCSASVTVGKALNKGAIVVYESTVYPGATEEICLPILERESGLIAGQDFWLGYSPERINPGDKSHRFETIKKIVSAQDDYSLEIVAAVYGNAVKAGVYRASSIKVAEAAKVIENAQRDLNIAFMNELSEIFHLLGIDTAEVLSVAGTKWNFLPFTPGLVGGHCIGVDPYYLTYRAEMAGYHPEVILAGRRINDSVAQRVVRECLRIIVRQGVARPKVTVLGLTFKEDVPDTRNSKVIDIIVALQDAGVSVTVHDPLVDRDEVRAKYGITLSVDSALGGADAVIFAVPHRVYVEQGWAFVRSCVKPDGLVMDIKSRLDPKQMPAGIKIWRM